MPKVSVIVAVYNVAQYIERSLHSLFGQTLDDVEYIFVDDGSCDGSCDIVSRVLEQYPHRAAGTVILRHERNRGVAAARTTGMLAATGEYIIHCDPDDYVELQMYETMYEAAVRSNADIVACDHFIECDGRTEARHMTFRATPHECLRHWYDKGCNYDMLVDKLIRRRIFTDNGILPYEGINSGEDFGCASRAFYYAQTLVHLPQAFYHYCRRGDSITSQRMDRAAFDCRVRLVQATCGFFSGKGFDGFCNNMKFDTKLAGRHLFDGREEEWVGLFRECHAGIISYRGNSLRARLLWMLALRSAAAFRFMKRVVPSLR